MMFSFSVHHIKRAHNLSIFFITNKFNLGPLVKVESVKFPHYQVTISFDIDTYLILDCLFERVYPLSLTFTGGSCLQQLLLQCYNENFLFLSVYLYLIIRIIPPKKELSLLLDYICLSVCTFLFRMSVFNHLIRLSDNYFVWVNIYYSYYLVQLCHQFQLVSVPL